MRVVLKHVSHLFEAEMIVDLLKQIEVEAYISVQNGPENMDQYLGSENKGVDVLVEEEKLERAIEFLDQSEIENIETDEIKKMPKPFPFTFTAIFTVAIVVFYILFLK